MMLDALVEQKRKLVVATAGKTFPCNLYRQRGSGLRRHTTEECEQKFWSQVRIVESGCWIWSGPGARYGSATLDGRVQKAHRIAWQLTFGRIQNGFSVCHSCDVTKCVNPSHLFSGTHRDNMIDMANKGRSNPCRGELNPSSVLKPADVKWIRAQRLSGSMSNRKMAIHLAVSRPTIARVISGTTWGHIL